MRSASVQTCITSPPYWGLRDYGTAIWLGGDPRCSHKPSVQPRSGRPLGKLHGGTAYMVSQEPVYREVCGKCGARRVDEQIGLEKTPEEYVAKLVDVFREVRRVLRDDGTLWLNLGDSYAASTKGSSGTWRGPKQKPYQGALHTDRRWQVPAGLKPKDLVGIPWMVAFALRADGWYLRSDIIWHKTNPMPESVTDRPTKSHEYLFLLSKSSKYFCDMEAIKEPCVDAEYRTRGKVRPNPDSLYASDEMGGDNRGGLHKQIGGREFRNKRTVWTTSSAPFKGAHFATFPPKLIEPCVLAGAPAGAVVLDPFNGAGTTGMVAAKHGRRYVGIELKADYCAMSEARLSA